MLPKVSENTFNSTTRSIIEEGSMDWYKNALMLINQENPQLSNLFAVCSTDESLESLFEVSIIGREHALRIGISVYMLLRSQDESNIMEKS